MSSPQGSLLASTSVPVPVQDPRVQVTVDERVRAASTKLEDELHRVVTLLLRSLPGENGSRSMTCTLMMQRLFGVHRVVRPPPVDKEAGSEWSERLVNTRF